MYINIDTVLHMPKLTGERGNIGQLEEQVAQFERWIAEATEELREVEQALEKLKQRRSKLKTKLEDWGIQIGRAKKAKENG